MITVDDDITVDGSSTTCSSPILYRQTGPVEGEEAGKWTQGTQNTQNNMSQLEALAELDSMLEPTTTHFVPLPCATANKSLAVPVAGKRKRALPELLTVFARVDRQSYSSLSSAFEVSELRLLLHASGFPVPSSTTKASCIEKLIKLHQEGSLRGLALGPANPPTHNTKAGNADDTEPPASWPVPLEGEGVYWESSAQHWRSLQDDALQSLLEHASVRRNGKATDYYLAPLRASEWQPCSSDLQATLERILGPTLAVQEALARWDGSRESFTPIPVASSLNNTHQKPNSCNVGAVLQNLRHALASGVPNTTTTSNAPQPQVPPPQTHQQLGERQYPAPLAPPLHLPLPLPLVPPLAPVDMGLDLGLDCLKLVRFRLPKVGNKKIVIQAKHREWLDPQADRVLCVGDELVALQLPGKALRRCEGAFSEVMAQLRGAPRPLTLGFRPNG